MPSRFLERVLYEAESIVIVNPQVAATMAGEFANRVHNQTFKNFLSRRIRQQMLRDPVLHVPIAAEQVQKMFGSEPPPDYVQHAIQAYKPLFMIPLSGDAIDAFKQKIEHLVDWFNSMEYLLKQEIDPGNQVALEDRALTQKALANLPQQTIKQATDSSEAWFARMGKRVRGSKSDVVVLKRWPDGFYGVQYRPDKNGFKAMQADGNDLENCLRHGHYEDLMKNGQVKIYAIRMPNDEAVVGIALLPDGSVKECKGKQNAPVIEAYAPYAAEFLNLLKAKPGNQADLDGAEIEYKNGRFFVFQHEATQIYDQQNVKVWKSDHIVLIQIGKSVFIRLGIDAGKLGLLRQTKIPGMDGSMTNRMLMALGALDMSPTAALAAVLSEKCDIHFGGSEFSGGVRYGKFADTAETVYNQGGVIAKKTNSEIRIWNNAPGEGDEQSVGFTLNNGRLDNMSPLVQYDKDDQDFDKHVLAKVLTAIKMAPTAAGLQMVSENKFGIDYKDGRWGTFHDVARVLYDRNGFKTWGTDSRIYYTHEDLTLVATVYGNAIADLNFTSDVDDFHPATNRDQQLGVQVDAIVDMLNTVVLPPSIKASPGFNSTRTTADKLFEIGILFTGAKYATVLEAGEVLAQHGHDKLIKVVTISALPEPQHNEEDPDDPITSGSKTHIILLDERDPYKPSHTDTWPKKLLDKCLNFLPFVFHHQLIDKLGRSAFVAMANATGLPYQGDGKVPRSYGIDTKGGAGKMKLVEAGLQAIFPGFYQMTPKSWVVAVDKGTVIYLTLRGGELSADEFLSQDRTLIKQVYPRAVQWIAKTHNIMNGPLNSGLLNPTAFDGLTDTVGSTFDTLLERIKNTTDPAYMPFLNRKGSLDSLERFFDGLGPLTKKQQLALYSVLRPRAPGYKIVPDSSWTLYGHNIEVDIIRLPAALFLTEFDDGAGITDAALVDKIRGDVEKAMFKIIEMVKDTIPSTLKPPKVYKLYKLQVGSLDFLPAPGLPQEEVLLEELQNLRTAVYDVVMEAERIDLDKIKKGEKTYKDYSEKEIMDRYRMAEQGYPWHNTGATSREKSKRVT